MNIEIEPRIIIKFSNGLFISETVLFGIIVAVILIILALISTRKMKDIPTGAQGFAELVVETIYNLVISAMGKKGLNYAPYIGTLFCFLILGNMFGLFGMRPTTSDVNMTFAASLVTFILIQYTSIKNRGFKGHLKHYTEPYPFMIFTKVIEDITLPISLGFRLFGNILGGVIVMSLTLAALEWISLDLLHLPIPILQAVIPLPLNAFFDIFEPILQAFIFTMLSMVFIGMAIVTHEELSDEN